jgi:hypothetical protein
VIFSRVLPWLRWESIFFEVSLLASNLFSPLSE